MFEPVARRAIRPRPQFHEPPKAEEPFLEFRFADHEPESFDRTCRICYEADRIVDAERRAVAGSSVNAHDEAVVAPSDRAVARPPVRVNFSWWVGSLVGIEIRSSCHPFCPRVVRWTNPPWRASRLRVTSADYP